MPKEGDLEHRVARRQYLDYRVDERQQPLCRNSEEHDAGNAEGSRTRLACSSSWIAAGSPNPISEAYHKMVSPWDADLPAVKIVEGLHQVLR